MKKIGLVTVLYNSNDVLDGFLKSVSSQTHTNYILYIIDNSPSSESDNLLNELLVRYDIESFVHIKNETNVGVAKANNQGIELSINDGTNYTILLNNDIEFYDVNLFETIVDRAIADNESLVIPKILFFDSKKIWMAGGKFVMTKGLANHIGEGEEDNGKFDKEGYFKYAPTCFMLINNKLFDEIGLMDEKYFVYYDDSDFVYRAYKKGYLVKYLPQIQILHKISSSTVAGSNFSIYYANRNRIYFIRKNFKNLDFIVAMSFTLVSRFIQCITRAKAVRKIIAKAVADGFKIAVN